MCASRVRKGGCSCEEIKAVALCFRIDKGFGSVCYESPVPRRKRIRTSEMLPVMRSTRRSPVSLIKDHQRLSGGRELKEF